MDKIHRCNPAGFAGLFMQNSYKCIWTEGDGCFELWQEGKEATTHC